VIRAALVALVLAALAGTAVAEQAGAPHGWRYDEGFSRELTRKAPRGAYFGGIPTTKLEIQAFIAPAGGSLFVTRAEATVTADQRDAAATHAVFELVDGARRQGSAQIETSGQRADPVTKLLEATITWRDPGGLRQIARTIVAGDASRLVVHTGECILPLAATKEVADACTAALATLEIDIAPAQRVLLAIVDAPAETSLPPIATAPAVETPAPPTPAASSRMGEPARLGDGSRPQLAPMTIAPAKRETDRRPLYLGGGIVVRAAVFWWNRRRRDRFDREEGGTTTAPVPDATSGDDDADDLQAAARAEAPKDEP